ncbi:MAG: hypothetical protein ACI4DP_13230 [Candidatus Ornithomonoglobus sp.]
MYNGYSSYDPTKSNTRYFYGLNRTRNASKGEFEEMLNMGTSEYPYASPRGRRRVVCELPIEIKAAAAPDRTNADTIEGLTGIAYDGAFYYNGVKKSGNITLDVGWSWEIIRMGNLYIINGYNNRVSNDDMTIMDGAAVTKFGNNGYASILYYYNIDTDTFSRIGTVMDNLCVTAGSDKNGNYLETYRYGYSEILDYSVTLSDGTVLSGSDFWDTYCNGNSYASSANIFSNYFNEGDEVTISGFPTAAESVGQVWSRGGSEVTPQKLDFHYNNTVDTENYANLDDIDKYTITQATVKSFSSSTSLINGVKYWVHRIYFTLSNKNGEELGFDSMAGGNTYNARYCMGITISKKQHVYEHIAAHQGRLWGVLPTGNMIYASASDDYSDTSSASVRLQYATRLPSATPGTFTALCEYGNYLLAFKESSITVIYGDSAANYSSEVINGIGCISPKSIVVTPSGVIFLSYKGFFLYSGSTPVCISTRLKTRYSEAVAGYDGNIYYVCACRKDETGIELLTYDMRYNVWHMQDDICVSDMFLFRGDFYLVSYNTIYQAEADDCGDIDYRAVETDSNGVKWRIVSARTYDNTLDNKSVNELWIRADVESGACFTVYTSIDDGEWKQHDTFTKPGLNTFRSSVRTLMGSSYRYKIEGTGRVVFYEIEIQKADGGRRIKEQTGTTHSIAEAVAAADLDYTRNESDEEDIDYDY